MEFLSANLQNEFDDHKPSLFELLSEQKLSSLIPPSIRYLLALATHRRPRYLLPLLNSFDEIYAALMLIVERHYLLTYGGGFTENFHGLKRERVLRIRGGEAPRAQHATPDIVRESLRLTERDVWRNLAVMIGIPYLKRKLDEAYDIHIPQAAILGPTYNRDALPQSPTIRQRLLHYYKWFLRHIYPGINAAYYFSLLAFNLAYLFDTSKYHSPFLWLIGTRIRRLGEADHRAIAKATERKLPTTSLPAARPGQSSSVLNPRTFMWAVYPRTLSSLRFLLPTSIFALQFLEWWYSSDFARQLSRRATEGLDLPPPLVSGLAVLQPHDKSASASPSSDHPPSSEKLPLRRPPIALPSYLPILTVPPTPSSSSNICPICLSPIVTPTACQTGYVFCYTCIFKWVDGSHERQVAFMEGGRGEEGWAEEEGSRIGNWESGEGRCAVTGRRVLGGTQGLRRVMV